MSQTAKESLHTLESLSPGSNDYSALLRRIMDELHVHNDSEEQKDLPLLERALGHQASEEAAVSFTRTKKFVPTR